MNSQFTHEIIFIFRYVFLLQTYHLELLILIGNVKISDQIGHSCIFVKAATSKILFGNQESYFGGGVSTATVTVNLLDVPSSVPLKATLLSTEDSIITASGADSAEGYEGG